MNKPTVLIIDDEIQIQKLLSITLESAGYRVISAFTLKEGVTTAGIHPPDIILLDIGLPDGSGQAGLIRIREWYQGPIIMLTVISDEENIIKAFDNGANDFLTKPFRTGELLARMRSLLRLNTQQNQETVVVSGDISIDFVGRIVRKNGEIVKLTATEFNLLSLLAKFEGRIVTQAYLLKEIWGPSYQKESHYLRVFIAQLRKKIETNPTLPIHIITEASIGYRFM
jgi:two-component system, OmpR family, KDP operon response regulator KdpE